MTEGEPSFFSDWFAPSTIKRALFVGGLVGTLLCLINQWQAIVGGTVPIDWLKIVLTYLVPYSVSSYSTAAGMRDCRNG